MTLENNVNENKNQYELLGKRLKEIAGRMTPEEIENKWGRGCIIYLQNIENFMVYLRKERRNVEERNWKVPKEFYDQTCSLDFPGLKDWYNANDGLKHSQKRLKKIIYIEKMLELIAKKFNVGIQAALKRSRTNDGKIRTSKDFKNICDTNPKAQYLMQLCGGNDVDVADIIAVVYDGLITRDDAIKLLQEPSLRDYLGEFRKPLSIQDIRECAEGLIPLDKNGVIASIIYRRLIEYRRDKLSVKPTSQQRLEFLKEMEKTLEDLI